MLVKTNEVSFFHPPQNDYLPDQIIGLQLTAEDISRKKELLGEVYNEEVYYGDLCRFLYALLT
jgi:hypothetical protein